MASLPTDILEKVLSRRSVQELEADLAAEKQRRESAEQRAREMHRRAQRLEGVEERVMALREGQKRWQEYMYIIDRSRRKTRREYDDRVREALWQAGVPSHIDGHPSGKEGRIDILVGRLILQRDRVLQERARESEREKLEVQNSKMRRALLALSKDFGCQHPDCSSPRCRGGALDRIVNEALEEKS